MAISVVPISVVPISVVPISVVPISVGPISVVAISVGPISAVLEPSTTDTIRRKQRRQSYSARYLVENSAKQRWSSKYDLNVLLTKKNREMRRAAVK